MSVVVQCSDVTVVRDGRPIIDRVSWTVRDDERWVVLGPNGAGKTTMLSLAAATLFPTSGTVWVLGEQLGTVDVFDLRPRIGMSSAALADRIPAAETVRDVVVTASYAVLGRGRERYDFEDHNRALHLMTWMGVDHLAERPFGTLSEGERKRVQLARSLMTDPELMLLDEPAAGLDLAGREDVSQRLTVLAQDPVAPAMVLVTHHVEEIPNGFTHVMMMRDGQVVAQGPIEEALTAQHLADTFGMALWLSHRGGRWMAYAAR